MGSPMSEPTEVADGAVTKGLADDSDAVDERFDDVDPREERAFVSNMVRAV